MMGPLRRRDVENRPEPPASAGMWFGRAAGGPAKLDQTRNSTVQSPGTQERLVYLGKRSAKEPTMNAGRTIHTLCFSASTRMLSGPLLLPDNPHDVLQVPSQYRRLVFLLQPHAQQRHAGSGERCIHEPIAPPAINLL